MANKTNRVMRKIGMLQSAKLIGFIEAHYTESKLTDEGFAKLATKELGFEVVQSHVQGRRSEMDIPSNIPTPVRTSNKALFELLVTLEKRIIALEKNASTKS